MVLIIRWRAFCEKVEETFGYQKAKAYQHRIGVSREVRQKKQEPVVAFLGEDEDDGELIVLPEEDEESEVNVNLSQINSQRIGWEDVQGGSSTVRFGGVFG
jgi:hypothetical protein